MLSHEDYYNMKYILKDIKNNYYIYQVHEFIDSLPSMNIEKRLKKRLKKRSDKIPGEEIREEIEVLQNGQIATLEMMEVPDSQNGDMVRKIDHID